MSMFRANMNGNVSVCNFPLLTPFKTNSFHHTAENGIILIGILTKHCKIEKPLHSSYLFVQTFFFQFS